MRSGAADGPSSDGHWWCHWLPHWALLAGRGGGTRAGGRRGRRQARRCSGGGGGGAARPSSAARRLQPASSSSSSSHQHQQAGAGSVASAAPGWPHAAQRGAACTWGPHSSRGLGKFRGGGTAAPPAREHKAELQSPATRPPRAEQACPLRVGTACFARGTPPPFSRSAHTLKHCEICPPHPSLASSRSVRPRWRGPCPAPAPRLDPRTRHEAA
jgi:hypothetical protein